jgi:hypothetical protein
MLRSGAGCITATAPEHRASHLQRALEPKRLVLIKGGYFDPYLGQFKQASGAAIDWFRTHLAIR